MEHNNILDLTPITGKLIWDHAGRFWWDRTPLDRPLYPSFRPRIKVFCFDNQARKEWLGSYRTFVGGYRETFDGFRKAAALKRRPTVEWPEGSYPPSCLYPIGHAA